MASYVTNLPVNGTFNITATFGQSGQYWPNGHKGVDFTAPQKTIYAICDGEVTVVGFDKNGWGRYVSIKPNGFERIRIITCHMVENSVKVKKGDKVSRTTVLGTMGSTGKSTGVHTHIEMRVDNKAVDPTPYLLIPNVKKNSLKASNFKFDAASQNTALNAIIAEVDGVKTTTSNAPAAQDTTAALQAQINALAQRLTASEAALSAANVKIKNAQNALK